MCCGSSLLFREIKALQESEDNHHVCFLVTCDATSPVCVLVTVRDCGSPTGAVQ